MRRIDLGQRPTSREELADWYATALAAQASSGLSVSAYAAQLGVTAATLYQWRRRLACEGDGDHEGLPANLVEVTLARSTPSVAEHRLLVRIGDGRRSIEVPRGFDAADLQRLVTALESC